MRIPAPAPCASTSSARASAGRSGSARKRRLRVQWTPSSRELTLAMRAPAERPARCASTGSCSRTVRELECDIPFLSARLPPSPPPHRHVNRYEFAYMERHGSDPTLRPLPSARGEAVAEAARVARACPCWPVANRSRADDVSGAANEPLPGVRGLVFFGFPLPSAGTPRHHPGRTLVAGAGPDVVFEGTPRRICDAGAVAGRHRPIREARHGAPDR